MSAQARGQNEPPDPVSIPEKEASQRRDGMALTSVKETLMVGVGMIQRVSGEHARHKNLAGFLAGCLVAAATPAYV